jgi:hypothetical protein
MSGDERRQRPPDSAGVRTTARTERSSRQHEKSDGAGDVPTGSPRGSGRAASDGGEVRSSDEAG